MVETRARIHPPTEKYWYYARKNLVKQYRVRLKRSPKPVNAAGSSGNSEKIFDVCGIDVSEEMMDRSKMSLTMQLANLTVSTLGSFRNPYGGGAAAAEDMDLASPREEEEDSDGEEPLLSGETFDKSLSFSET